MDKAGFIRFMEDNTRFFEYIGTKTVIKVPRDGRWIFLYTGYGLRKELSLGDNLRSAGVYDLTKQKIYGDCTFIRDIVDKELIGFNEIEGTELINDALDAKLEGYAYQNEKELTDEFNDFIKTLNSDKVADALNKLYSYDNQLVENLYIQSQKLRFEHHHVPVKRFSSTDFWQFIEDSSGFIDDYFQKVRNSQITIFMGDFAGGEMNFHQAMGLEILRHRRKERYFRELENGGNTGIQQTRNIVTAVKAFAKPQSFEVKHIRNIRFLNVTLFKNDKSVTFKYPIEHLQDRYSHIYAANSKSQQEIIDFYDGNRHDFKFEDIIKITSGRKTIYEFCENPK